VEANGAKGEAFFISSGTTINVCSLAFAKKANKIPTGQKTEYSFLTGGGSMSLGEITVEKFGIEGEIEVQVFAVVEKLLWDAILGWPWIADHECESSKDWWKITFGKEKKRVTVPLHVHSIDA